MRIYLRNSKELPNDSLRLKIGPIVCKLQGGPLMLKYKLNVDKITKI